MSGHNYHLSSEPLQVDRFISSRIVTLPSVICLEWLHWDPYLCGPLKQNCLGSVLEKYSKITIKALIKNEQIPKKQENKIKTKNTPTHSLPKTRTNQPKKIPKKPLKIKQGNKHKTSQKKAPQNKRTNPNQKSPTKQKKPNKPLTPSKKENPAKGKKSEQT